MMHCCIESIFSFSTLFWGNFKSEIQIGITFEWIGFFRCEFQQSLSHNIFYYLKCLAKNLFLPFQLIFKPSSEIFLLTIPRRYFFCGSLVLFVSCVCHAFASLHCCLAVTCWERADLLALVCDAKLCICHFQMWYPGSDEVLVFNDSCPLPF